MDVRYTLRRWRDRVDPAAVGVATGGRRRAAGLRREELAALAGISVDYLTRLEQGRATTPSTPVVEALSNLVGPGSRAVHTPSERATFEAGLVATLRMTAGRYPSDHRLRAMIGELRRASPRFVKLWETAELPDSRGQSRRKVIDHPDVGLITLDCDVLTVAGDDLRVTVYTAEPDSHDAENLNLTLVLGTQAFTDEIPEGAAYSPGTRTFNAVKGPARNRHLENCHRSTQLRPWTTAWTFALTLARGQPLTSTRALPPVAPVTTATAPCRSIRRP